MDTISLDSTTVLVRVPRPMRQREVGAHLPGRLYKMKFVESNAKKWEGADQIRSLGGGWNGWALQIHFERGVPPYTKIRLVTFAYKLTTEKSRCRFCSMENTTPDFYTAKGKPSKIKHGSISAYAYFKCRCPLCKEARAEDGRKRGGYGKQVPARLVHGTTGGYTNHKCRCQLCKDVWSAYCRARKVARSGRVVA